MKLSEAYVRQLNRVFNKFAGKEVSFTAETHLHEGRPYTLLTPADRKDPLVAELRRESGQDIVFLLQDKNVVTGERATYPRLQALVAKNDDGSYRLTKNWNLGVK